MPNSLRSKIKHFCYKGELNERERDRILNALDDADRINSELNRVKTELGQQPCEDWVNREDVKSGMIKYGFLAPDMTVTEFVEDLPSVTPKTESGKAQPKQIDDSCLDFDFDKVKEILKKDGLDNLIVDHTCEEKQEQTRDEKTMNAIDFAIKATDAQDDYSMGMRNGMRYVKSLIDGKEPQYELRWTDEEIKLGINLGDEVVDDYGAKGVVVGIDTYKGEVLLSLLMRNHKVPQLVKASSYKTKTSKHFPQIIEVLEQIKGEADGK